MRPNFSSHKEGKALITKSIAWKFGATICAVGIAAVTLTGCQQRMGVAPYYEALDENPIFSDGRASRPLVPGTVFRGNLKADDALYTGKVNGVPVEEFPIDITRQVIERGQNRYNIYCAPCHSQIGDGNGMIVQRGVSKPPAFNEPQLVDTPPGHVYDVISNGIGRMYSYDHIPVYDRWAITAYVKVLQQSSNGTVANVPDEIKEQLNNITTGTVSLKKAESHADAKEHAAEEKGAAH